MNDTTIELLIKAQDETSAEIRKIKEELGGMNDNVGKSGPSFLSMASAVAVGQAALQGLESAGRMVVGAIRGVIDAAIEEEGRIAQTNAVLTSTHGVAGMTSDAITNLADSYARTTPFSDDVVRSTENMLLTFTNIKSNIFPQTTETVLNMATALGEDTKNASIQLGKALQDPVLGVTALRRVGVAFTDDQKEQIKTLVKSGQSLQAQQIILKELGTEFGGSALAAGKTFGGQMKILGNNVDMMKESIGKSILTAINPFIQKLTDWAAKPETQKKIEEIAQKVGELTQNMIHWIFDVAVPWIQQHWPAIHKGITDTIETVKGIIEKFESFRGTIDRILLPMKVMVGINLGIVEGIIWLIVQIAKVGKWIDDTAGKFWNWLNSITPVRDAIQSIIDLFKNIQKLEASISIKFEGAVKDALHTLHIPGFATGVQNFGGGLAYVHQGEVLTNLPQGSNVIPKDKVSMGQTVHINLNGPIYARNPQEATDTFKILARQLELVRIGVPA